MARKTEMELRKIEIKPLGESSWSRGLGFPCRLLYDKSREAIEGQQQYVIMFPNGERMRGRTEEAAIEAARKHADTLVTTTSEKIMHIQWSHGNGFQGYQSGVDLQFGWSVLIKETRKRIVKGTEVIEVRYLSGPKSIEHDWRIWDPTDYDKDNRDGLSELVWSAELEAFCKEMEQRMKALHKQIDQMLSPKHIKPKKLAAVGKQFLLKALPAGEDSNGKGSVRRSRGVSRVQDTQGSAPAGGVTADSSIGGEEVPEVQEEAHHEGPVAGESQHPEGHLHHDE